MKNRVDKPWGYEEILEHNRHYTVKRLFMAQGQKCSYQYHNKKHETIVCLSGDLTIVLEDREVELHPGDHIVIPSPVKHRMFAKAADSLYLECSTSELDDVVRIEDEYGRK